MRNAAPQVFEDFYKAFERYTEDIVFAVVNATSENLQRAQGQAQQCVAILRVFEEVRK